MVLQDTIKNTRTNKLQTRVSIRPYKGPVFRKHKEISVHNAKNTNSS